MARGNQREKSREKNLKKQAEMKKGQTKHSGQSLTARKEHDAQVMREKQLAKQAAKESEASGGASK